MVSIIMATYNRAHFIEETIQSILNQVYKSWELLIVDDGSEDNTLQVLMPYLRDSRIRYFQRNHNYKKGLPGCRNKGLDHAKGEYVIFFDDDDIVHPQNLKLCVDQIHSRPDLKFCRYRREVFEGKFDKVFDTSEKLDSFPIQGLKHYSKLITQELPFNSCSVLWRKECFNDIRFKEELLYAEEWECYTNILTERNNGISIDKTLYYGRKHNHSNTGEFYTGNPIRVQSKIKASKSIIDLLNRKGLMTPRLYKYFGWMAVLLKSKSLYYHLESYSSVDLQTKVITKFKYYFSFLFVIYLHSRKFFK
ncbi:glycosyltransferase involved in cell wall biosynthesis [Leeuwenhoekiella aestuarii]|uniref:glycosyltransferase family 2 protein n=1 Tax=Leeuwenhoekiella aestuarii TaxID=2249426 RepID=UPI000FFEA646|nr:glycosyltransferase family 2 protein [Leeuwenhoekiella aestuarii]RXG13765.1 glycosyltransferase involved in cell wall biosynthesis [Leeuwenhoekiella aestuarii]